MILFIFLNGLLILNVNISNISKKEILKSLLGNGFGWNIINCFEKFIGILLYDKFILLWIF